MSSPQRIQRSRERGWRMPDGAIYVGRPSRWGNPWREDSDAMPWLALLLGLRGDAAGCRQAAVTLHRAWIEDALPLPAKDIGIVTAFTLNAANMYLEGITLPAKPDLAPLRGHDLVCWCKPDEPCHADVLLALANAQSG